MWSCVSIQYITTKIRELLLYNATLALCLTTLAGLSTVLGAVIVVLGKVDNAMISRSMAFSAGVMIYVSLVDLLMCSQHALYNSMGTVGGWVMILSLTVGMALMYIVGRVPLGISTSDTDKQRNIGKAGIITAIAIAVHNFPEGIVTFISVIDNTTVALPVVVAIALHNIPEGVALSAPIYYCTHNARQPILYSLWCGLAEPLGALLAWWILLPYLSSVLIAIVYGVVAGIMIYISIAELLPTAWSINKQGTTLYTLLGMILMAISIVMLA